LSSASILLVNWLGVSCDQFSAVSCPPVRPIRNDGVPVKPWASKSFVPARSACAAAGVVASLSSRVVFRPGVAAPIERRKSWVT